QAWKVAAILLACLIGLHLAGKTAELSALKRSEKTLDTSIGDTYRMAMPGQPKPLDPRRQMEMRFAAAQNGGGQGGLLPALQALVWMKGVAPFLAAQAPMHQGNGESLIVIVDRSARESGLGSSLAGTDPSGAGGIQVRLEKAPFDAVIGWLSRLSQQNGIGV